MPSEPITSDPTAHDAYPPGSMRVQESATPDGRRLLYFTFPELSQGLAPATGADWSAQPSPQQPAGA